MRFADRLVGVGSCASPSSHGSRLGLLSVRSAALVSLFAASYIVRVSFFVGRLASVVVFCVRCRS